MICRAHLREKGGVVEISKFFCFHLSSSPDRRPLYRTLWLSKLSTSIPLAPPLLCLPLWYIRLPVSSLVLSVETSSLGWESYANQWWQVSSKACARRRKRGASRCFSRCFATANRKNVLVGYLHQGLFKKKTSRLHVHVDLALSVF